MATITPSTGNLADLVAGAAFGSALFASSVYMPSVIYDQLRLRSFHMLTVFMGASATSAIVIYAADRSGYAPVDLRPPRSAGYFPYDKNIIGGALTGAGMALAGACPGTVLVQIATGVSSAPYIGLGALLGGLAHSLAPSTSTPPPPPKKSNGSAQQHPASLQAKTGLSTESLLLAYEAVLLVGITAMLALGADPDFGWRHGLVGGALIGAAQAATVLLTRRAIGVSRAYGDFADYLLSFFREAKGGGSAGGTRQRRALVTPSVAFAAGVLGGSYLLRRSTAAGVDVGAGVRAEVKGSEAVLAVAGGLVSVLGSRIAGGCTSGHGISGMATFSVASFVTIAAMFGTAVAVKAVLP